MERGRSDPGCQPGKRSHDALRILAWWVPRARTDISLAEVEPRGRLDELVIGKKRRVAEYNYQHFWLKHFVTDLVHTAHGAGVEPGSEAPDFDLEAVDGTRVRLSELRGRAVLLHFGSGT